MPNEYERGEEFDRAVVRFEQHLTRAAPSFWTPGDGASIGIDDPVMFADLQRSLEHTNRLIKRGEINPEQITRYTP